MGYIYYCPMRPPAPGAIPTFGLQYIAAYDKRRYDMTVDRMVWGFVVYNRPLSPSEVAEYELVSAPRVDIEG